MNAYTMLSDARKETDKLFALVRPDWLYERPIAERHRLVFYLGHLEAFDWNLLRPHMRNGEAFRASFDRLFAFGIDPVDGGLPSDSPSDWPSVAEIRGYNQRVRQRLDDAEHDTLLLHMAVEHRLMHAETLAYMLHQLPLEGKDPEPQAPLPLSEPIRREMIGIPAGCATLGLPRNAAFGWDNEFDAHPVEVPAFAIDRYKVTNRDYLEFVEDGGYRDPSLWTVEGWQWKAERNITHPAFWRLASGKWRWRTMFDEIPLPLDWPVYVSHAEASAYAKRAGFRLPTESEWHRA
ncbi:MAG: SUMF1/EgtB/PvdO family nonheme iron enzyme, partial [Bryobacteraceae bacterium]